jgi:chaperonin GroES
MTQNRAERAKGSRTGVFEGAADLIQSHHSLETTFMDIRPLHDRIIVRRIQEGEQKVGGIIIPDTAKEKPQQGRVVSAGNGKVKNDGKRIPLDVKAGDLILFGKYTSQEVKLDGEEYLIMREDEVLAVIDGNAAKKNKK